MFHFDHRVASPAPITRPTHARAAFGFHSVNDIARPLAVSDSETTYNDAST